MSFRSSATRDDEDQNQSTRLPPLSSLFKNFNQIDRSLDHTNSNESSALYSRTELPQQSRIYGRRESIGSSFGPFRYSRKAGGDYDSSSSNYSAPYQTSKIQNHENKRVSPKLYNTNFQQDFSTFDRLWDIFLSARRHIDAIERYSTSGGPRPLPSIRAGDVTTLSTHLQYELDILSKNDSYTAERLFQEADSILNRNIASSSRNTSGQQFIPSRTQNWQHETAQYNQPWSSQLREESQVMPLPPSRSNAIEQQNYHRYRTHSSHSAPTSTPRRVRKRLDEADQSCLCCSAKETPEWRKGPTGPRTLCNACGLLWGKHIKRKDLELQSQGRRMSSMNAIDSMTKEEREQSLLELKMAVQARQGQLSNTIGSNSVAGITPLTSSNSDESAAE